MILIYCAILGVCILLGPMAAASFLAHKLPPPCQCPFAEDAPGIAPVRGDDKALSLEDVEAEQRIRNIMAMLDNVESFGTGLPQKEVDAHGDS